MMIVSQLSAPGEHKHCKQYNQRKRPSEYHLNGIICPEWVVKHLFNFLLKLDMRDYLRDSVAENRFQWSTATREIGRMLRLQNFPHPYAVVVSEYRAEFKKIASIVDQNEKKCNVYKLALTLCKSHLDLALEGTNLIEDREDKGWILSNLARIMSFNGQKSKAQEIAEMISDPWWKTSTLSAL